GLALIVPGEQAAERHDAHRMRLVLFDRPLRDVELVRALVVEVAVAGLPEPVPVVVDEVVVVLLDLRRATPEIPVEMRRGILRVLHADSAARLAAVSVGDLQLSELPGADRIVKTLAARVAPALRAGLDHGAVFLPRLGRDAAFIDVVARGLLDVAVLSRLRRPDRHQRVPMVRSRDGDRVDVVAFEDAPNVGLAANLIGAPDLVRVLADAAREDLLVRVDEEGNLHVLEAAEASDVRGASAVDPAYRDAEALVGAEDGAERVDGREAHPGDGTGSAGDAL